MTEEELEKGYYANRPIEPYSDDDCPNDWANIAHYAEENLEKAFKHIEELTKEIGVTWHKVADGDLPKETEFIESDVLLLLVQLKGTKHKRYELGRYIFSGNVFCYTHLKLIEDVVAWCEIPKYTER